MLVFLVRREREKILTPAPGFGAGQGEGLSPIHPLPSAPNLPLVYFPRRVELP